MASHQTEDRVNQNNSSRNSSNINMTLLEESMTIISSNSLPPSAPPSEDATSTISSTDSTTTTTTTTAAEATAIMMATSSSSSSTSKLCTTTTTATAAAAAAASSCRRLQGHVCVCEGCESTRSEMLGGVQMNNKNKRARLSGDDDDDDTDTRLLQLQQERREQENNKQKVEKMSAACRTILECMGEDPTREGLVKTPERWAKALLFMSSGYQISPEQVTNDAVFCENHHEMVVVRNIDVHSLCEHHMLPFTGRVHIGYIPNGKVIGLSKLARIAELYARRLQVQERLTSQIADAILETVQPLGVAVVMECTHFCMVMRGVQKTGAVTTTSSVRGCFETNSKTRAEFFSILHGSTRIEMH